MTLEKLWNVLEALELGETLATVRLAERSAPTRSSAGSAAPWT